MAKGGRSLRDELLADPTVEAALSPSQLDDALDPRKYLGSAGAFIARALADYRRS
jgi:3-carboxy-cis,cis-muconate cycloisomerase